MNSWYSCGSGRAPLEYSTPILAKSDRCTSRLSLRYLGLVMKPLKASVALGLIECALEKVHAVSLHPNYQPSETRSSSTETFEYLMLGTYWLKVP